MILQTEKNIYPAGPIIINFCLGPAFLRSQLLIIHSYNTQLMSLRSGVTSRHREENIFHHLHACLSVFYCNLALNFRNTIQTRSSWMCGIIGRWSTQHPIDRPLFDRMRDTLAHRGPDGCGSYFDPLEPLALGHRRLAFLDLSDHGKQPLCNETGDILITANGEIYNYLELRTILTGKGHRFFSETDTEVLIHAYEEWGMKMLDQVDGMFAFGLWDRQNKKLILARDRFGIKPLYYYCDQQELIFASEIKAIIEDRSIRRTLDYSSLCDYFVYRYIPSPKTIFKNIYKLPPAHYIEFSTPGDHKPVCYYTIPCGNNHEEKKTLLQSLDRLMLDAVQKHVRSEVPIGSFLSGGYDSSAMVRYFSESERGFNTFSIGFQDWDFSEHQYAEKVARKFGTNHHSEILDSHSLELLPDLMYWYDEPIADISIIPTYAVSKLAARYNKAVLSGEGADEIFAGYNWHHQYLWPVTPKEIRNSRKFGWELPENKYDIDSYARAMSMGAYDQKGLQGMLNDDLHSSIPEDVHWFYRDHFVADLPMPKRFQLLDLRTFMGELVLTKVDRASMANSLEVRVPFLENKLVELMMNLDPVCYFEEDKQKILLRKLLRKYLPNSILNRKKQGFVGPDSYYTDLDFYGKILSDSMLEKDHLVRKDYGRTLLDRKDHWRLWKLTVFELWYRKWMTS